MVKKTTILLGLLFVMANCQEHLNIEPANTCFKNVFLGDKLQDVKQKIENLRRNYEGADNEYFSISESSIQMNKGQLNPSIFLKFNANNELYHFSISYTYDGLINDKEDIGKQIFDVLLNKGQLCLKGESLNGSSVSKNTIRKTNFKKKVFASFHYEVYSK